MQAILLAIIQAIIAGIPAAKAIAESVIAAKAPKSGLDPVKLIKLISEPDVEGVNTDIDAEINATWDDK